LEKRNKMKKKKGKVWKGILVLLFIALLLLLWVYFNEPNYKQVVFPYLIMGTIGFAVLLGWKQIAHEFKIGEFFKKLFK